MRKFNLEEFIWFVVLIFMNMGVIYLIKTDKAEFYIGDKMIKYMYMTVFLLSILSIFQVANVFTPKGNGSLFNKIFPIIFALIIGVISIKAQDSFRHNELYDSLFDNCEESHEHEFHLSKKEIDDYIASGNIIIDDTNLEILMDMKKNPDDYIGKNIEFKGFVCKDGILSENMFIVGRVHTTCCAADSRIMGILAEYEHLNNLKENDWVNIKGNISCTTVNNDDGISHRVPLVQIVNLEKLQIKNQK
ncbi:MAG: TIGR03943 family protein [Clostridium butyricum]|nr:TIGR03943 family protein [Clostridium butyricum]